MSKAALPATNSWRGALFWRNEMDQTWWLFAASGLCGALFVILLIAGVISRARAGLWLRRRGFTLAAARAAERFARGEIDGTAYRRLRDDLRVF
jgi:uncharacterized membrane protein